MIQIQRSKTFVKHFQKRIAHRQRLSNKCHERIRLFLEDPMNPVLKNHPLKQNMQGHYAFSVTGDIRIVYYWASEDVAIFVDIGTHAQIYGM